MSTPSLDIAATGMQAQQMFVDVTSNNLANVNTTAYKLQVPLFQDLLYQDLHRVGSNSSDNGTKVPSGIQVGLGVKLAAISRNVLQGTLQATQGPLDLSVQGKGYFQITLPDGSIAYTRDGAFQLSPDGIIVTADGFQVQPAITIPPDATSISINQSGQVSVTIQGQADPQILGQFQTASFINPPGLLAKGSNLFLETSASGTPQLGTPGADGFGTLSQGFLESSNVNPITELTNLIKAQRVYEMNSTVVTKTDQMLSTIHQATT
jgi:flagellar basal-body rod protein FlgG